MGRLDASGMFINGMQRDHLTSGLSTVYSPATEPGPWGIIALAGSLAGFYWSMITVAEEC